jgi:tRNA threonylcarbamoyladenosine biosynthesis protein TsaE
VVTLVGELGTGKTTFVRGAARALGVTEHVTSPTFTVAQRYSGRVTVAHLDAYRLGDVDDEELGLALEVAEDAVAFVEWPEALAGAFPDARVAVTLLHRGGDRRLLTLTSPSPRVQDALRAAIDNALPRHGNTRSEPGAPQGG